MREINKIAEGLFEKIRDRFEDVSLGDDAAKATQNPEKARFFNFDYVVDDQNLGNITLSIVDETSLKVYFSKNISHDLDVEQKQEWYGFLRELREFAKRNLLSFEPRDITRSTLKHRDIQQISKADSTYDKDEVVAESKLYGTSKSSYEKFGPARIIVRHSKAITDDENRRARTHNINAVYVENHEGERFKMPFKSLTAARAMARHVSAGGAPHDELGQHICEMAQECVKLKPFLNNVRRRTFEDTETQTMVEAAFEYHGLLNNTLKRMSGKKGYTKCKEQFVATSTSYIPEVDTEELKERFIKRIFDDRMEEALPLVYKAYDMKKNNKFTEQFENWANTVSEGTWALPEDDQAIDKLIELLSSPLPAGVDGQNATNALYDIIGDDQLFDRIEEVAKVDPNEDVRSMITDWLRDHLPHIYQQIEQEIGDADTPAEPAEDNQEVDESYEPAPVVINGKQVDLGSIELDGVESWDRPDYADAYVIAAEFTDGTPLTEPELDELSDKHGDIINAKAHDMLEGNTYGSGDGGMDGVVYEDDEDDGGFEAIQSAIIRRIAHSHHDLLRKLGPDGVLEAAREVAEFAAPVEEIGSSDVSAWVNMIERDAGIGEKEMNEAKDKVTYDPKTGKLTGWEHEGDWKKSTGKNPVGKIHNLSDKARRETEKLAKDQVSKDETLEEAFERALGENYDTRDAYELEDPKHPDFVKNYEEYKSTHPDAKLADFIAHLRSRKNESVAGDDHVNKDVKMKRMGAKELGIADKFKIMPSQIKAMNKGDSENDLLHYNKLQAKNPMAEAEFNEAITQMRKIAGLK